ncbi:CPBP family intramembrane glutamic endopeptidase [Brachybacterium sp. YJGR34]|uniref:CPBP family intramembrane glutamic endopeptidase n=1 Tax=Brachybacterium sp. YJGR34 TaxID=2059911 RepID=UPI000E0C8368|nr:type II CAAX endopeptidase family protein [Brachybacterium sp. YJGR34]
MRTVPGSVLPAAPPDRDGGARDRPVVLVLLAAVFVLAVVVTTARNPDGVVVSADPGYAPVPVPLLLVPTVLAVVLTLLLPRGAGDAQAVVRRPRALRGETAALLAVVIAFPLLVPVLPRPEDYVLLKAVLFLLVPCLGLWLVARRRGASVAIRRPGVRWWVPVTPALLLGVLSSIGPFSGGVPASWPPLVPLLIAATATAITAGVGEEVVYRRLLQTRLEAVTGPWSGLLIAALLFGLMHAASHGGGALWEDALQALALQGTTGIALGLLWARWRRLWACVLAHILLNGATVLLHVVGTVASAL